MKMKTKLVFLILAALLSFSLCACGSTAESASTPEPTPTPEPIDEELCLAVSSALPYYAECNFSRADDGDVNVRIKMSTDKVAKYGELIYKSLKMVDSVFPDYHVYIIFWSNNSIPFTYMGTLDHGMLNDSRSGEAKVHSIASMEDLTAYFPMLSFLLNAEANGVSIEEYDRYNSVIDELNDASRTEQEILETLAPQYNMTTEELEAWLYDIMDKIY